jgi:hypothetical protein
MLQPGWGLRSFPEGKPPILKLSEKPIKGSTTQTLGLQKAKTFAFGGSKFFGFKI